MRLVPTINWFAMVGIHKVAQVVDVPCHISDMTGVLSFWCPFALPSSLCSFLQLHQTLLTITGNIKQYCILNSRCYCSLKVYTEMRPGQHKDNSWHLCNLYQHIIISLSLFNRSLSLMLINRCLDKDMGLCAFLTDTWGGGLQYTEAYHQHIALNTYSVGLRPPRLSSTSPSATMDSATFSASVSVVAMCSTATWSNSSDMILQKT